jgi:hypothetical protein
MILGQKVLVCASYSLFLILFLDTELARHALNNGRGPTNSSRNDDVWAVFAAITVLGCALMYVMMCCHMTRSLIIASLG